MSYKTEESEDEVTLPEEEEENINIGLYIGGRNSKGERDGRGWAILPNGDQYDGHYRLGKRHGIGLYVFAGGARYFGQYHCGHRSGRGIFIYPDGSFYEGCWRKNLKHGKGRYCYHNGDCYCGSWQHGLRHGIGIYTTVAAGTGCHQLRFMGTWRQGVRVGPFQLSYGNDDKCTTLHGSWDNLYPQGPAVFNFNQRYLLTGYFQTPGCQQAKKKSGNDVMEYVEENVAEEESDHVAHGVWPDEPTLWFAQDICTYDYALLPQEPVPLPLTDSDISICSLSTAATEKTVEKEAKICAGEGEEEEGVPEVECVSCECECSTNEMESSSQIYPSRGDPCAIEIVPEKC